MRLLLHCCCGPCTTSVADYFVTRGDTVEGWFHNPNLAPDAEWHRRRETFAQAATALSLPTRSSPEEAPRLVFFLLALARGTGRRCHACYRLRLGAAAKEAAVGGFDGFATTLVISPYQDFAALAAIGEEVGMRQKVAFQCVDLRDRYGESRRRARELGLYRQNYCGCLFSKLERAARRAQKAVSRALAAGPGEAKDGPGEERR